MCSAQEHRGPDSRGIACDGPAALGIQRLRVVDLQTGDQPVFNEDRTVSVVLNGEIYNYPQLRSELSQRGHRLETRGDTEVIAHLYEEMGDRVVERLDGMFAFALWDSDRRRLLIARDRVGKKPLHYWHDGAGQLSFASELSALLADPDVPREMDLESLDAYLAHGYIGAPWSIYRGVRKLPPAHILTFQDGRLETSGYWDVSFQPKHKEEQSELEEETRRLIGEATRKRMLADVPLGAFLSGGIDSAIVVSEMAAASARPVSTFSIGFAEQPYNELPNARLIAERFGTNHREMVVTPDAVGLIPELVRHYGEPFADSSAIPSFYLAQMAREHVTVALNGDGGDESFAGYVRTAESVSTAWLDRLPFAPRNLIAQIARSDDLSQTRRANKVRRVLGKLDYSALDRYRRYVSVFDVQGRRDLLLPDVEAQLSRERTEGVVGDPWRQLSDGKLLDRLLNADLHSYLPGDLLVKVDIATMAHSLEARSPLLDHHVIEFAARIPSHLKVRRMDKKRILRSAYRGIIPSQILDGPKRGFGIPIGDWFRGQLLDYVTSTLTGTERRSANLINTMTVKGLIEEHRDGRVDHSHRLFALVMLEGWLEQMRPNGS